MQTRLVVCFIGLVFCSWSPTRAQAKSGSTLSSGKLSKLGGCMLSAPKSRWQFSDRRSVQVKNQAIGVFQMGWWQLVYAMRLPQCLLKVTGRRTRGYRSLKGLARLARLPIFGPRQGSQKRSWKVNYYNPRLIRWIARHVPSPQTKILGLKLQDLYDTSFRRFIRITAYTYLYLNQRGRYARWLKRYKKSHLTRPSRQTARKVRRSIRSAFSGLVRDELMRNAQGRQIRWVYNGGHAALFWMRRGIGGTDKEFWALLRRILKGYDGAFLSKYENASRLGPIRIQLPKLPPPKTYRLSASQASTLQGIVRAAPPRSKILLRAGVYSLQTTLQIVGKRYLTFEGRGRVILRTSVSRGHAIRIQNSHHITFRGLQIENNSPTRGSWAVTSDVYIHRGRSIWLDQCKLTGRNDNGLQIQFGRNLALTRSLISGHHRAAIQIRFAMGVLVQGSRIQGNGASLQCARGRCGIQMQNNQIQNNQKRIRVTNPFLQKIRRTLGR